MLITLRRRRRQPAVERRPHAHRRDRAPAGPAPQADGPVAGEVRAVDLRHPRRPFKPGKGIVSTRKGDTVYVHVLQWHGDSIVLPALPKKVLSAALLTGGDVKAEQSESKITLTVPKADQQEIDTIIALKLDGPAEEISPVSISK